MSEQTISILRDVAFLMTFIITGFTIVEKVKAENKKMFNEIDIKLQKARAATIRRYLIDFLSELELGIGKNEQQKITAYETYDEYKKIGGNSYVDDFWNKVMVERPNYGDVVRKSEEINRKHEEEKQNGTTCK